MSGVEVGLTGGIGSGKSTVGQMLTELGAKLIDADVIVRKLQSPGQPVFKGMVAHFGVPKLLGGNILLEDGTLNRKAIAEVVFNDAKQLETLNNIVHPPLETEILSLRKQYMEAEEKTIVDSPLLVEVQLKAKKNPSSNKENQQRSLMEFDGVIVVECDTEVALGRLVNQRGFLKEDALARMDNQASPEERRPVADFLIENNDGLEELKTQVQACWDWISSLK